MKKIDNIMRISIVCNLVVLTIFTMVSHAAPVGLTQYSKPREAPDFRLQDTQGKLHTLANYRGKVLIVNFWTTWCVPCRKELPSLKRATEQLRQDDIHVVSINKGQTREVVEGFNSRFQVNFPLLLDVDSSVSTAWRVTSLPTAYVLDPAGHIIYRLIGGSEWDDPNWLKKVRMLKN